MTDQLQRLAGIITATLAAGLLILFGYLALQVASSSSDPPRLADPAPTTLPVPTGGVLPAQYRGSYDPNSRGLAVLAIVSPLLTTVIGFYFGQRAGEAGKAAVVAQASSDKAQIKETLARAVTDNTDAQTTLDSLHSKGLLPKDG